MSKTIFNDGKICRAKGCLNIVDENFNKVYCKKCTVYLKSVGLL